MQYCEDVPAGSLFFALPPLSLSLFLSFSRSASGMGGWDVDAVREERKGASTTMATSRLSASLEGWSLEFFFCFFFFFFLRSVREKLDGQGVSNFFSEIDLWNFFSFLFIGRCEKIRWRGCWRGRKKSVCSRPFSGWDWSSKFFSCDIKKLDGVDIVDVVSQALEFLFFPFLSL